MDLLREGAPAPAGAAVVELEDDEAAIGEVLPEEAWSPRVVDELRLGPAVDHDDRRMAAGEHARAEERAVERLAVLGLHRHVLDGAETEGRDVGIGRDGELAGDLSVAHDDRRRGPVGRGVDVDPGRPCLVDLHRVYPALGREARDGALGGLRRVRVRDQRDRIEMALERAVLGAAEEHAASGLVDARDRLDVPVAAREGADERAVLLAADLEMAVARLRRRDDEVVRPRQYADR